MTQDEGGVGLKMTSLFYMISRKNFKQFDFKCWFYYRKIKQIDLFHLTTRRVDVRVCIRNQNSALPKYLISTVHCMLLVT